MHNATQLAHAVGENLRQLEHAHLVRLGVWAGASVLLGLILLGVHRQRAAASQSPALLHFGIQTAAWGAVSLGIVWLAGRAPAEPRDLAAAVALDRFLWLNIGLDVGYAMVGIALLLCGRHFRRPGLVGAGLAVVIQGAALAALDLQLSAAIVR